jgi:uncharacterized membrane protein
MTIEIIPNWHPIFVHFTIALFSTAALLFLAGTVFAKHPWSNTVLRAAHINLWLGGGFTIFTLLAGWDAYNTVAHDGPSHAAMTDHRNWALATATAWGLLTLWSAFRHRKTSAVGIPFVAVVLLASGLLATTGFKGAEAVYRYGLGVKSLPHVEGDGGHGNHSHGETSGASESHEHSDGAAQDHHAQSDETEEHGGHAHEADSEGEAAPQPSSPQEHGHDEHDHQH